MTKKVKPKKQTFNIPKGYVLMPLIVDDKMSQAMGTYLWQDLWDILVAEVGKHGA